MKEFIRNILCTLVKSVKMWKSKRKSYRMVSNQDNENNACVSTKVEDELEFCVPGNFTQKAIQCCSATLSTLSSIPRNAPLPLDRFLSSKMAASTSVSVPFWPNNEDGYELIEVVGVGATAVVYSAYCKSRKEKCAIKMINLEKWNTSIDELFKEIQAMSSCNHDNVVTYYTSFVVKDELWLIMKLLEGGSLLDVIKHKMKISNCKHGVFDEATVATVLREVLKGIEYFHNNGQIHRDIKAGNILLGQDGIVQIADFGVSAWLATDKDMSRQKVRHTFVGTPCWMAPEVMQQDHGYDFKADIWSFGITAIEMATGTAPYHKYPPMKVLMLTLQNDPPNLDTGAEEKDQYTEYGITFRKFISDCLQKDPSKRPTATELLKHPFFKKAKDRNHLTETLVILESSPPRNINKVSKRPPTPGRLQYTMTGEWIWSEGEETTEFTESYDDLSFGEDRLPMNRLEKADSSSSDNNEELSQREKQKAFALQQTYVKEKDVINLVLRLRNTRGELNDIKFEFILGQDTAQGIASELVTADLVNPDDSVSISTNLGKLLDEQVLSVHTPSNKTITFPLNAAVPSEQSDIDTLVGFAQISVIE